MHWWEFYRPIMSKKFWNSAVISRLDHIFVSSSDHINMGAGQRQKWRRLNKENLLAREIARFGFGLLQVSVMRQQSHAFFVVMEIFVYKVVLPFFLLYSPLALVCHEVTLSCRRTHLFQSLPLAPQSTSG